MYIYSKRQKYVVPAPVLFHIILRIDLSGCLFLLEFFRKCEKRMFIKCSRVPTCRGTSMEMRMVLEGLT